MKRLGGRVVGRFHREVACHWGVERHVALLLKQVVKCRDVAEADKPLGVLAKAAEVQLVNQVYCPIAATAAEDDLRLLVIQCRLQVLQPLLHAAGIGAIRT